MFKEYKDLEINMDLLNKAIIKYEIKFNQNDLDSARITFNINKNGVPVDLTQVKSIYFYFKRADGKTVFQTEYENIDASKGIIRIILKSQTLEKSGVVVGQLKIDGENSLESPKFTFEVIGSLSNSSPSEAGNDLSIFQKAVELINNNDTRMITLEKDINTLKQGGSGGGSLSFQTLADLQKAFPNGTTTPVWIVSENSWYYWDVAAPTDTTPPNNVTNLVASNIATTTVTLSWTASTSSDTVGYDIYKGSTYITTVTGTSYNVSGLTASTSYTFTVKAKDGSGNVSSGTGVNVTTANTTPSDTTPPVVTASPNGGTFTTSQQVTLSANETATIYYTLDGSTPTTSSSVYSSPITISSTTTLKFIGKDTAGNVSTVQSATFTKQVVSQFPILDSFNRADNTLLGSTDTSQTWTQFSGANGTVTYGIKNNRLYASGGTDVRTSGKFRRQATLSVPSNNFSVEYKMVIPAFVTGVVSAGLRYNNDGDLMYVSVSTAGIGASSRYTINKLPYGGSVTSLATGTKVPQDGDQVKICHYSDGKIEVYVNGSLDCTATDTYNLSSSIKVGFGTDTTDCGIDDLKIDVLP